MTSSKDPNYQLATVEPVARCRGIIELEAFTCVGTPVKFELRGRLGKGSPQRHPTTDDARRHPIALRFVTGDVGNTHRL